MESNLFLRLYADRPRKSTLKLTRTAAKTIYDRKISGQFTDSQDIALTSLPAPSFADWLLRNNVTLLESRL